MIDPKLLQFAAVQMNVVGPCTYGLADAVRIAEQIVDRSLTAQLLESSLTSRTGAPRRLSWRTALVIFCTTGILGGRMPVTRVHGVALDMFKKGLIPESVSYCQVWDAFDKFTKALDGGWIVTPHTHTLVVSKRTGELADCPDGCTGGRTVTREVFSTMLLVASAFPPRMEYNTRVFALDSTDKEAWAARRSWARVPDIDQFSGATRPEDEGQKVDSADSFSTPGWPRMGADGRVQHTVDADAREGYRSGKNARRKEVFLGWDVHLTTPVSEFGDPGILHPALSIATAPAGSDKAAAGLLAIDALTAVGLDPLEVLSDRGYTYLTADKWAADLYDRGILQTFDLHTNQRGVHPGPVEGTIMVDGGLFSSALPEELRELPKFRQGMSPKQKAELTAQYDKRIPYAFAPYGQVDARGGQRWRGPARRGLIRCTNFPESMDKPRNRPTVHCDPTTYDENGAILTTCGCAKTVTLPLDFYLRERQPLLYGTTEWFASYSRRSAIEQVNSEARTHRDMNFNRDWCRVHGTARNHAMITFGLVGMNVRMIRDWYRVRLAADPWLVAFPGGPGSDDGADLAEKHKHRKRRPRSRALHEALGQRPFYLRDRDSRKSFADFGRRLVPLLRLRTTPRQPG
jgi:hypothetical protein